MVRYFLGYEIFAERNGTGGSIAIINKDSVFIARVEVKIGSLERVMFEARTKIGEIERLAAAPPSPEPVKNMHTRAMNRMVVLRRAFEATPDQPEYGDVIGVILGEMTLLQEIIGLLEGKEFLKKHNGCHGCIQKFDAAIAELAAQYQQLEKYRP